MFHFIFSESEMTKEIHSHILFLTEEFFTRWKNVYANINTDAIIVAFTQKIVYGI